MKNKIESSIFQHEHKQIYFSEIVELTKMLGIVIDV